MGEYPILSQDNPIFRVPFCPTLTLPLREAVDLTPPIGEGDTAISFPDAESGGQSS